MLNLYNNFKIFKIQNNINNYSIFKRHMFWACVKDGPICIRFGLFVPSFCAFVCVGCDWMDGWMDDSASSIGGACILVLPINKTINEYSRY